MNKKYILITAASIAILMIAGGVFYRIGMSPTQTNNAVMQNRVIVLKQEAAPAELTSTFSYPYPVSWEDGGAKFSVTGASLKENNLTLNLKIQIGNSGSSCVPLNLRLVLSEEGDMIAPVSPSQLILPDSGGCYGRPNNVYEEPVTFSVNSLVSPFLITTGGTPNLYFEVSTTTNGIKVEASN